MTLRIYCPSCSSEVRNDSDICPSCGTQLDDPLGYEATQRLESVKPASGKTPSFDSIDNARFVPGTILADRYRIVGLLGKGGMGEVYRADDLKLSQPVALKFLPDRLMGDAATLARFHREVRVARQVSHKNVCRVYDIGELDGQHFLSMEFIKGEELSSLLRRIGRLPADKAIQVARQICAGLAAAHESGVMHRDLKPSNIMIDGDGNARITDFGLAGLSQEFRDDELSAGTPAYMSPEQLHGQPVTVRSDIYSLGLVFYELFTGKRAFEAATLGELMRLRRSDTTPTTPSEIVSDIDPVVERLIDRCIQKDPARRPHAALQVAAALPGGDPIAAALAAGETPSPEMVAAAPKEGALRPIVAVSLLASILLLMAVLIMFVDKVVTFGLVPLDKSSELLGERAREVIRKAGYESPSVDSTHGFQFENQTIDYIARTDRRPERWQDLKDGQPAVLVYWYRESPTYLANLDLFLESWNSPPPTRSGMTGVRLDTRGRLLDFYAVPPQLDPVESQRQVIAGTAGVPPADLGPSSPSNDQAQPNTGTAGVPPADRGSSSTSPDQTQVIAGTAGVPPAERGSSSTSPDQAQVIAGTAGVPPADRGSSSTVPNPTAPVDWSMLFDAAGLRLADFKPTTSEWSPLHTSDTRLAWAGVYPEQTQIPIRIEAASYRGKPVYFAIVNPWSKPERQGVFGFGAPLKLLFILLITVFSLVLVGSVFLAVRNLRLGRGDRKGALRLGIFVFTLFLASRLLATHHVPSFAEFGIVLSGLQEAVFGAVFLWVLYIALEPFVRKRWPNRIISWSRLLAADFRDPLVGRDVLIGASIGLAIAAWQIGFYYFRSWLGDPSLRPAAEPASWHLGIENFAVAFASQLGTPLLNGFAITFLILLLALLLRRDWLAFALGGLIFTTGLAFLGGATLPSWINAAVTAGLLIFVLYRYGLLAFMVSLAFLHMYITFPVTIHLTAWYATGFVIDLIIMLAVAFYAFHTSLAGQPLFGGKLLQED